MFLTARPPNMMPTQLLTGTNVSWIKLELNDVADFDRLVDRSFRLESDLP